MEELIGFLDVCREEQHWDLIYVWKKLVMDRAFYWSATGKFRARVADLRNCLQSKPAFTFLAYFFFSDTAFGIELALSVQQRSGDRREIFKNQDKNPFKTEEFQSSLGGQSIEQTLNIDASYY